MPSLIAALRSAPEQKAPPAPVSTTARTLGSSPTARRVAPSAAIRALFKAFFARGRFMVRMATGPSRSRRRLSSDMGELCSGAAAGNQGGARAAPFSG